MEELLKNKSYWESYWKFKSLEYESEMSAEASRFSPYKYLHVSYHNYLLWNVIYSKFMPKSKYKRAIEIGSAPGHHLVRLNKIFDLAPYGVEYSREGVEINKKIFRQYGLDENNIIYEDFLSDSFQRTYKDFFDVVISRGVIEDIGNLDTRDIVKKHSGILKKGGRIFIAVPNFGGINFMGLALFEPKLLKEINFDIMSKGTLVRLFEDDYDPLFCDYYGIFNCGGRFISRKNMFIHLAVSACDSVQKILNLIFRTLFRDKGIENRFFSPYLIYVGVKK